ncbi:MAG: Holliday junction resolvase RuvX [Ginsengibacter sp.]
MPRLLCIDYGKKRTGIAISDPLQIIASGLCTVESKELIPFLKKYIPEENVSTIILGEPKNIDERDTHATHLVRDLFATLNKVFPHIPVVLHDETYSSKKAKAAMIEMGLKRKDRRVKGNVDVIAATIILQEYMEENSTF